MACEVIHHKLGRIFTCGDSTQVAPVQCVGCGKNQALSECDAHFPTADSDTCDAKICSRCLSHVDFVDLDMCPAHASMVPLLADDCLLVATYRRLRSVRRVVGGAPRLPPPLPPVPCAGAVLYPSYLCLAHARLYFAWAYKHGGSSIDAAGDERRLAFMNWLDAEKGET